MGAMIQVFDKPFEEMTLAELKIERRAHGWARRRMQQSSYHLTTKLYAMREKYIPPEERKERYANGEWSANAYHAVCMQETRRKNDIEVTEAQIQYGFALEDYENAVCNELDELIIREKARQKDKKSTAPKQYDPRKNLSWNNRNAKNMPNALRPPKKVKWVAEKWNAVMAADKDAETQMRKMEPIAEWSKEKFLKVARAHGIYTEQVLVSMMAEELRSSIGHARKILNSGKMTWGQIIVLAAMLEMTPMEFCDVFLSGVFREVVDGKWIAVVDDKDALLAHVPTIVTTSQASQDKDDDNDER